MKKFIDFIKKIIKPIFIISFIILLISEFSSLSKEISLEKLEEIYKNVEVYKLLLIGIVGLLGVLPMLYYEVIYSRMAGLTLEKRYLYETSFSINTLNGLIGFGGLINIGLRLFYYGKGKDTKELTKQTLKMYPFYFVGFSLLSIISIIYIFLNKTEGIFNYWPWLVGGLLYGLVVVFLLNIKKESATSIKDQVSLTIASVMEWLGAILPFMFIGIILGVKINLTDLFVLLVVANIIGMASMIPGGLGSFDFVMISGLISFGLAKEMALMWILLFRLAYFIIPGIFGILFFVKYFGKLFDEKNDKVPSKLVKSLGNSLSSILIYLFGLFLILSATIPDEVSKIKWLSELSPIRASQIYQLPSLVLGFVFILLGRANLMKVKKSFKLTISLLIITLVYANFTGFGVLTNLYIFILFLLLFSTRDELYREQFIYSAENKTKDGLVFAVLAILYIIYGHYNVSSRNFLRNTRDFIIVPFYKNWLSITIIIILVTLFLMIVYKILSGKRKKVGEKADLERSKNLLDRYGGTINSGLVFLEDKALYWYKDESGEDSVAIQFTRLGDKIIVMGEPMGKKEDYPKAIEKFIEETDDLCYNLIFYEVPDYFAMDLHDYGFDFIKFGESAKVNVAEFSLDGKGMRNQRHIVNKFEKDGYKFKVLDPPYTEEFIDKLEVISNKWLKGRMEKGFSLGFFKRDYMAMSSMAIVEDPHGEIIAFSNLMPVYDKDLATIDLMRYDSDFAPNGTMDYLFINLFRYSKDKNKKFFDMGMAPLSNVGRMRYSFIEEKLAFLVYKFGDHFYSFEGLRDFKEKYASEWEPLYLSYSSGSWLLYLILSMLITDIRSTRIANKILAEKDKKFKTPNA